MPYRSEHKKRAYFKNLDKAGKRECNTDYYVRNSDKVKARGRSLYEEDPSKKKAAVAASYKLCPGRKCAASKSSYTARPELRKAMFKKYHTIHRNARLQYSGSITAIPNELELPRLGTVWPSPPNW